MNDEDQSSAPGLGAALARLSPAEFVMRFGCGAICGLAVVASVFLLADVFGTVGMRVVGIGAPLVCGVLALFLGDRFLAGFARIIKRWP